MRVAFIGFGSQARQHLAAFRAVAGVEIAGAAARDGEALRAAAREAGVHAYPSPEAALADPTVTAVVVATPSATHSALTMAALEAGKHVLCETPIALTVEDARAMETAAARTGRVLRIGLNRFEAPLVALVELVRTRRFGAPVAVATRRLSALHANGLGGGHHGDAIEELLAFDLHFLLWAFGPAVAVSAHADWRDDRAHDVSALVELKGVTATCFATQEMPRGHPFTEAIDVQFEGGGAILVNRFRRGQLDARFEFTHADGRVETLSTDGEDPAMAQARCFVGAVAGRPEPDAPDAAAARALLETTLACAEAARAGRRMTAAE